MNQSKRDRIAARAFEIWEAEGRPANKSEEHWRRAEQEVAREDESEQMGGHSEPDRELDTRPAPPIDAAPSGEADAAREDAAAKRSKPKAGRSRRPRTERQRD